MPRAALGYAASFLVTTLAGRHPTAEFRFVLYDPHTLACFFTTFFNRRLIMLHRFLCFVALAGIAGGLAIGQAAACPANVATIVVRVPADAKLYFDGVLTEQTGTERTFVTPPLRAGQEFRYELKVELASGS